MMKTTPKSFVLTVALLLHALVSALFILGVAANNMSANYDVAATLADVFPYIFSLTAAGFLLALLISLAIAGLLIVQIIAMDRPVTFNILGACLVVLLSVAASLLNSNSMQSVFSFVPDGFRTTIRVVTGTLSENDWSADTWVFQATALWWLLLWCGIIIWGNLHWVTHLRTANNTPDGICQPADEPPKSSV